MILTEEEAKDKLCPMSFNHPESTLKCYGSKCMWWRVAYHPERRKQRAPAFDLVAEPKRPKTVPGSWHWVPHFGDDSQIAGWEEPWEEAKKRRKGYCGMCPPSK